MLKSSEATYPLFLLAISSLTSLFTFSFGLLGHYFLTSNTDVDEIILRWNGFSVHWGLENFTLKTWSFRINGRRPVRCRKKFLLFHLFSFFHFLSYTFSSILFFIVPLSPNWYLCKNGSFSPISHSPGPLLRGLKSSPAQYLKWFKRKLTRNAAA